MIVNAIRTPICIALTSQQSVYNSRLTALGLKLTAFRDGVYPAPASQRVSFQPGRMAE